MMHDPLCPEHPPVHIVELPRPEDAEDYAYFARRLADVRLLERSVVLSVMGVASLAVPVGGTRHGGFYSVPCMCFGLKVRDALLRHAGFPRLRLRPAPHPRTCDAVEWGGPEPTAWSDEAAMARFHGFVEPPTRRQVSRTPA